MRRAVQQRRTKVKARTVSRLLRSEEANLYEEWIRNRRMLEDTKRRMLSLSKKVAPLLLRNRKSDDRRDGGCQKTYRVSAAALIGVK